MSWLMGIFTFINTWCVMLFFVLPVYTRPARIHTPEEYAAAPAALPYRKVIIVNTLISFAVTLLITLIVHSGLIHLDTL